MNCHTQNTACNDTRAFAWEETAATIVARSRRARRRGAMARAAAKLRPLAATIQQPEVDDTWQLLAEKIMARSPEARPPEAASVGADNKGA